jgi:hypothetical protein
VNRFLLTAILLAAYAFPCAAQTKEVVAEVEAKLTDLRVAALHADERAEDVEILRRLLNKSLGMDSAVSVLPDQPQAWHTGSSTVFNPLVVTNSGVRPFESVNTTIALPVGRRVSQAVGPIDGVYLKGTGVVYTLHIPAGTDLTYDPHTQQVGVNAGCAKCHQDAKVSLIGHATTNATCTNCHKVGEVKPGVQPVSEWEQTRMAVRGEKPKEVEAKKTDKPRGVICEPGTLVEQLTDQLSAHARNVRHLGEKESITVVVTFDHLPGPQAGAPAKLGLTPDEVQFLTLGDLHLKQKKYPEAVEAYLKGLVRFKDTVRLSAPANTPYKDVTAALEEMTGSLRATYKSLAAAYLGLNDLHEAGAALEKARNLKIELSQGGATSTKPVGPAKLILSVSKTDIGATGAAFKKAVRVDRVNFPAAEKTTK